MRVIIPINLSFKPLNMVPLIVEQLNLGSCTYIWERTRYAITREYLAWFWWCKFDTIPMVADLGNESNPHLVAAMWEYVKVDSGI